MRKVIFNLAILSAMMPSLRMHKNGQSRLGVILALPALCALAIAAVLFIGTGAKNALAPQGSHDFQWTPATDVLDGVDPYRGFIDWNASGNDGVPMHFLNQSPSYPASTYVLLSPLAHFEWEQAKAVWLAANLVFIILLLWGMQKTFPVKNPTLLAFLVLAFLVAAPMRTSLGAGQHNFISLAAFIWAYYFSREGNNQTLAGLLLAVAWIKYSLTFPLTLIFLRRGGAKPVVIAALVHAVCTSVVAWRIGMWPQEFFFSSVKVVLMGDGTGFLNLIAICMNLDLPLPAALCIVAAATLAVAIALVRNERSDELSILAFLGLFSCAVFYHHGYDFVVLILCAWAVAQNKLHSAATASSCFLLFIAWVGQWLAQELTPVLGPYPALCADYLLISVFYCTLFLLGKALFTYRPVLLRAAAKAF